MQISETQADDAALALHPVMSRVFHPSRHGHVSVLGSTCNPTIIELRVRRRSPETGGRLIEQTCLSGLTGKGKKSGQCAGRVSLILDLTVEDFQAPQHRHRGLNYFSWISLDTFSIFSVLLRLFFHSLLSRIPVIKGSPKPAAVTPSHWPGHPDFVPAVSFLSTYTSTLHTSRSWYSFLSYTSYSHRHASELQLS
jgi:hypothetical protein